jgi:hypothetical protein
MTKAEVLAKKKWLKNRRREKRVRKQHNYYAKTHKGQARDTFYDAAVRAEEAQKEKDRKNKEKAILGMFGGSK